MSKNAKIIQYQGWLQHNYDIRKDSHVCRELKSTDGIGKSLPEIRAAHSDTDLADVLTYKNGIGSHINQEHSDIRVKRMLPTTQCRPAVAKARTNPSCKQHGKSTHYISPHVQSCHRDGTLTIPLSGRSCASSEGSLLCDTSPTCNYFCKVQNSNQKCSFDDKWHDSLAPRFVLTPLN